MKMLDMFNTCLTFSFLFVMFIINVYKYVETNKNTFYKMVRKENLLS